MLFRFVLWCAVSIQKKIFPKNSNVFYDVSRASSILSRVSAIKIFRQSGQTPEMALLKTGVWRVFQQVFSEAFPIVEGEESEGAVSRM